MHITVIMVLTYIACCVRLGTAPWKYFQLNARYFSSEEGIFSKLAIDGLIPMRWRLPQHIDDDTLVPGRFPVFLKPEWGQNAQGIHRVDDAPGLARLRTRLRSEPRRYLLQEAAPGQREFEIFTIASGKQPGSHEVLTVTEAVNLRERFPINSKYNRHTRYVDISMAFDAAERQRLSGYILEMGRFGISRVSVRADSREALLAGFFHVIEINLFLPMPINLLDGSYSWPQRLQFIGSAMMSLARATRAIEPVAAPQPIFTRMMLYSRRRRSDTRRPGQSFGGRALPRRQLP